MADLTPIIGRGKTPSKQLSQLTKQRKRMLSQDKPTKDRMNKRRKTEKTPPRLEHLPVELLQTICVYSLEINLPLASPRLMKKLSNKHIYMRFCFQAFFKNDYFLLDPDTDYTDQALTDADLSRTECQAASKDSTLQSTLLKRTWLTWSLYREYLHNSFRACTRGYNSWISKGKKAQEDQPGDSDASNEQSVYQRKLEQPQPIDFDAEDLTVRKEPEYRWFRLLPTCQIPEKLLRTPFTRDQVKYLRTLVRAGAVVDWYGSAAGELAETALEYAIEEGNLDTIRLLLHEAIGIPWHERYLERAYAEQAQQSRKDFEPIISQLKETRALDERRRGGVNVS